jgi:quinol-cytochrome oxidoreductase complex cytochrome b subunit
MKLDRGMHIVMHLVFVGNTGVTHMFAQHVVLVGFVVIVVTSLTLWMFRYRCVYT